MSTATPGYVFQCHAPPTPSPSSTMTKSLKPASSSLMATPMPENPAPTTMTSWSGAVTVLIPSVSPQIARCPGRRYFEVPAGTVLASTGERKQVSLGGAPEQVEQRIEVALGGGLVVDGGV